MVFRIETARAPDAPRLSRWRALLPAAALTLNFGATAHAAEPAAPTELAPVTVAASRSDTKVEDMPLHTTVISREQILASPALTLDQLLRNVPGLNFTGVPVAQSDPTGHQTRMRGLGNAKVLVLLDGVPIHDPFYLTTQFFKLPLTNIERVEVVRGGYSSLWGNMATAGVVNIISRRATDNAGEFTASYGMQSTSTLAFSKNFAVSDSLGFSLSADRFHTNGYQTTPAEFLWRFPAKKPVEATNTNVLFTTFYQPSPDLKAMLRVGYHEQDQQISYDFGRNLQKNPDVAANVSKSFAANGSVTATAWAQNVDFDKYNGATCYRQASGACPSSAAVTPNQVNNNVVQYYSQYGDQAYRERGAALVYSNSVWLGRGNSFQLGADYRKLNASDLEQFYSAPAAGTPTQNFNSTTFGRGQQAFVGLFGQFKFVPVKALEVTLSGRYDSYTNSDRTNTRTTAAGRTTGGPVADLTKTAFSPGLAVRYDFTDHWSARAAAYKAFRAPGFNNITRTFGTGTGTTIANPDLNPERLKGWEAGLDYNAANLNFGATYFLYRISDMIATYTVNAASANIPAQVTTICGAVAGGGFSNCGGPTTTSVRYYTNDQDGESHGVELTGQWKVRPDLTLNANYTYTSTFLTRRGAIVTDPLNVQIAGVPRDTATVGVTWMPIEKLRTYAELRYIGTMPYDTTSVANRVFEQGSITAFNASVNYAVNKSTDVFMNGVNLFNRDYTENTYAATQPFNRTLSMPRMVSAGVRLRF